jgi:DNA polymerase-3 subunit gamma/tau
VKYQDVLRNLNVLDYEYSFALVDAFLKGDYPSALLAFDEILTKGFNALHFIAALSSHLRDLIVSKSGGLDALLELPDSLKVRYKEQAERCHLQFLYEALSLTTQCESGYRASVNPRLHIEFALMRLSFLVSKPAAQPQPAVQPAVQLQPAVSAPAPAPAPAPATAPAPTAQPATQPAAVPAESAPQAEPARERRTRAARSAAALSMKAVMEGTQETAAPVQTHDTPAPSDEVLQSKWPELSKQYADKPRLASMLSSTTLTITGNDESKTVVFRVVNEAQKDWVESKLLHELEGRYRALVGSMSVYLRVDIAPDDAPSL